MPHTWVSSYRKKNIQKDYCTMSHIIRTYVHSAKGEGNSIELCTVKLPLTPLNTLASPSSHWHPLAPLGSLQHPLAPLGTPLTNHFHCTHSCADDFDALLLHSSWLSWHCSSSCSAVFRACWMLRTSFLPASNWLLTWWCCSTCIIYAHACIIKNTRLLLHVILSIINATHCNDESKWAVSSIETMAVMTNYRHLYCTCVNDTPWNL